MARKKALRLHLDDDLLAWVKDEAARRRISYSAVLRELILAAMDSRQLMQRVQPPE